MCDQPHSPAAFPSERDAVSTVQKTSYVLEPVWTGAVFSPHRDLNPRTSNVSKSLYRLNYPGPCVIHIYKYFDSVYVFLFLGKVKMFGDVVACNSHEPVRISQDSRLVSIAFEESHGRECSHCERTGRKRSRGDSCQPISGEI